MDSPANEACPTIVGGQPHGKRERGTGLPHGLESIVLLAAADPGFREQFSRDREKALQRAGIHLTGSESGILQAIGDEALFGMARRFEAKRATARGGLRVTAASLAALASLTVSSPSRGDSNPSHEGSGNAPAQLSLTSSAIIQELQRWKTTDAPTDISYGIQPDTPTPTETQPPVDGIRPDTPTPTLDPIRGVTADTPTPTVPVVTGILPDTPTTTVTPTEMGILPDTPTKTLTATPMGIFPDTPTPTPTFTLTLTPTFSETPTGTATQTPSDTPTETDTVIPSETPTLTDIPTLTGTATSTGTPTFTETPIPSDTPTQTTTPTPSETTTETSTPTPSSTATPTQTRISADLDANGIVDSRDLLLFLQEWYRTRSDADTSQTDLSGLGVED